MYVYEVLGVVFVMCLRCVCRELCCVCDYFMCVLAVCDVVCVKCV